MLHLSIIDSGKAYLPKCKLLLLQGLFKHLLYMFSFFTSAIYYVKTQRQRAAKFRLIEECYSHKLPMCNIHTIVPNIYILIVCNVQRNSSSIGKFVNI